MNNEQDKPLRIDLACGQRKKRGFIGVDISPEEGVDVVVDLEKFPWPFEDNSVDEVHCAQYIEHIENFSGFFNELYRIMKPGAEAKIACPYYTSVRTVQDYTHKRAISEQSFLYVSKKWRVDQRLDFYDMECDFDFNINFVWHPNWKDRPAEEREFARLHYWNVVEDLRVTLIKL